MAHVMKIKAPAVAAMVGHYERRAELDHGYRRDNIDPNRTEMNYNLRPSNVIEDVKMAELQHEQITGKALRKDANVLMDWVVTLPKDCSQERSREFFESVTSFIEQRYGKGNVLGAYVHMDEATPHVHVPVIPVIDGKLQASKMINRQDLRGFHGELSDHVEADLGFHVSVELDDGQQGEKQLSHLGQQEYVAAKDEIAATKKRLECLQQREIEMESAKEPITKSVGTIIEHRDDGNREQTAREANQQLAERVRELEQRREKLAAERKRLKVEIPEFERRVTGIESRLGRVRSQVEAVISRLEYVPDTVSRYAQAIAEKLRTPVLDQMRAMIHNASEAARKLNSERLRDPRDHGRGMIR